jgi:hypothetical protein
MLWGREKLKKVEKMRWSQFLAPSNPQIDGRQQSVPLEIARALKSGESQWHFPINPGDFPDVTKSLR